MNWICTEIQLPPLGGEFLLFVKIPFHKFKIMIGYWNGEHFFSAQHTDEGGDSILLSKKDVSHWQPLPNLPDDVKIFQEVG